MVIFISLAAALVPMGASRPLFALVAVALVLVLCLSFLRFAFVTTLLNRVSLEILTRVEATPTPIAAESLPKTMVAG